MTVFSIIVCILFIAFGLSFVIFAISEDLGNACAALIGTGMMVFGIALIIAILTPDRPTAIDVYRNKTTLEITYRDSIPVDTVVVFKDE